MSKILIVDDDFTIKLELEEMLKAIGYNILGTAENGGQAVELAQALNPDLILMDIVMPGGLDGISAAEKIKQESPDIAIVFMTGYGDPEYVERAKMLEPFGYVMKPFEEKEISAVIEIALHEREMELKLKNAYKELEEKNRYLQKEIRERRKTQEALFESEARYRELLNTAPAGIYEVDFTKKQFTHVNDAICEYTGYSREELLSMGPLDILTEEGKKVFSERLTKLFAGKKVPDTAEFKALRKDGTEFWALLSVTYLYENEKLKGERVVAHDITERKQAVEALRRSQSMLARTERIAGIGSWEWDIATDSVTWSEELFRFFQQDPDDGAPSWADHPGLYHPEDFEALRQAVERAVSDGEPYELELRALRKDCKTRMCLARGFAEMGFDGRTVRLFGLLQDITDRKQAEEERERLQVQLREARKMEAIGTLTGGIAHDYNNLMSIIMGNLSLAQEEAKPGSDLADFLNEANMASRKVRDLTHELMSLSRGGGPVREVGSLEEVLKNVSELIPVDSGISLMESISQDLKLVPYDRLKMKAVIRNVVKNAVEAMPDGGTLKIKAENLRVEDAKQNLGLILKPGDFVCISIQDKGNGIPEEHLGKIFDPYFSSKERGVQKGMGLGLTTAYAIIKQHGGHIQIDSPPGAGTTVNIYFPAESDPEQMDSAITPTDNKASTRRILVMDDEESLRSLVQKMLERLGHKVDSVKDGVEAIETYKMNMVSGDPFDAVMLDLTIKGGMGGEQTMRELLKINPNVKAIVCSGYFNDPVMSNFEKYGFRGALPKPYAKKTLKEVLERLSE